MTTHHILLMLCCLLCAACTAQTVVTEAPSPTPSLTDTPAPTATQPATPTDTPTPMITLIPTANATELAQIPTLDPINAPIGEDLLGLQDEDCQLPCWYGLRIGESTETEVVEAFSQAFGLEEVPPLHGEFPFYVTEYPESPDALGRKIEFRGRFDEAGTTVGGISTSAHIDMTTSLLTTLSLRWAHPHFLDQAPPQEIVRVLGEPTYIFTRIQRSERADLGTILLQFYYPGQGMWFVVQSRIGIEQSENRNSVTFCFGDEGWQRVISNGWYIRYSLSILNPYTLESTENLDEAQLYILGPVIEKSIGSTLFPIEEVFGIDEATLYERITQEENTCISTE